MAINKQSARIKNHTVTTTGTFTVPASEDFTDGSWDKWDLAKSEIGVNTADVEAFLRIASNIREFAMVHNSPEVICLAASDESTALDTTGNPVMTFRMPFKMELEEVRASLTTAGSTSGTTTIDINLGGASIFTTNLLTIDYSEKTSTTAATAPNITTTTLTDDGEITIDIDAVTGGANEAGLKIYLIGRRTL